MGEQMIADDEPTAEKVTIKRKKRTVKPKHPTPMKLDIGCGKTGWQQEPLDEWVHLDKVEDPHVEIVCDFADIPLDDASVDEIFIGDVVEHIPLWKYDEVLCEWNRILKPGGIVGGRCPNIDRVMRDYAEGKETYENAFNSLYGWGNEETQVHYRGYTRETLTALLKAYGILLDDFSGSPGPVERPWWLVFTGYKFAEAQPIGYGMERFRNA